MFGHFSLPELIIIMVVILLLFGARRIPEIAGSMGKGIREFKKQMTDLENDATGRTASYPPPRLTADDLRAPAHPDPTAAPRQDELDRSERPERPEPKRLI